MKSIKFDNKEIEYNVKLAGSGLANINLLENEKKLTYNSIINTSIKMIKLKKILEDKKLKAIKTGTIKQPFEETQITKHGLTVADYRTPKYEYNKVTRSFSPPKIHEDIPPFPVKDENIIRIRHQNVKNIIGKKIISEKIKFKEDKLKSIEERKLKNEKKYPKISIP